MYDRSDALHPDDVNELLREHTECRKRIAELTDRASSNRAALEGTATAAGLRKRLRDGLEAFLTNNVQPALTTEQLTATRNDVVKREQDLADYASEIAKFAARMDHIEWLLGLGQEESAR